MFTRRILALLAICALLALGALVASEGRQRAQAIITSPLIGNACCGVQQINPPASVRPGQIESNTLVRAFSEKQKVKLSVPLDVNALPSASCTSWNESNTANGNIPAGRQISSHLLHADPVGIIQPPSYKSYNGSVSFDKPILGVMFLPGKLDASDGLMGSSSTLYPVNNAGRGFENSANWDVAYINCSGPRTLTVVLTTNDNVDQIRVITDENDAPTCSGPGGTVFTKQYPAVSSAFSLNCSDLDADSPITCSVIPPYPPRAR